METTISMSKSQKLILNTAYIEEEFFEDVLLIGIVSPKPAHQLIWHLNQSVNVDFKKNHSHEKKIKDRYFSVFSYEETNKLRENIIYCNRNDAHYLIPEAKNIDYIWLIKGGHERHYFQRDLLNLLPNISIINYVFEINPETLKSRAELIL